jgi:hypothetical protein
LNKIQLAAAETQVAFGVEDIIRDAYINGATEYPVNEKDPDEAVDAYAVSSTSPSTELVFDAHRSWRISTFQRQAPVVISRP